MSQCKRKALGLPDLHVHLQATVTPPQLQSDIAIDGMSSQVESPCFSIYLFMSSGGRVKTVHGTSRVYLPFDDIPGLAMSRSLGDFAIHTAGTVDCDEVDVDVDVVVKSWLFSAL